MRRTMGVLISCLVLGLAGCGGSEGTAQGESVGDDEYAGEGTRDAGSVAEQVSAEDVSELEKLREQVAAKCNGTDASQLPAVVRSAVGIAAQNNPNGIVDLSQVDRAENIEDFLGGMAELLENCGAPAEAERLRQAEFGTALPG